MEDLNRLALLPATFIQFWAGGRFYRAAWRAARHGATNMDTLIAVGTTAAWGYSVAVTLWPSIATTAGLEPAAYFDSSTIIIGFVLLGRWLEARAKGQAGRRDPAAARRSQPPVARRVDGAVEIGRRRRRGAARRPAPGPARRAGAGRRRRGRRRVDDRPVDAHRRGDAGRGRAGRRGHRRDPERERLVRHARHARRPRHGAGAHRRRWSSGRRAARRRSSASPTGSARCSCRSCWSRRRSRSWPGSSSGRSRGSRSP